VFLAVSTEVLVRTQVVPQDNLAGHLRLLEVSTQRDAAFGDSHVARGFDAQGSFVNLAFPSENIEDIFSKVERHYSDRQPGRVILQADPHLFAAYRLYAPPQSDARSGQEPLLYSATARHRPQLISYWMAFFEGWGQLRSKVHQTANGSLLSEGDFSSLPDRKREMEALRRLVTHRLAHPSAVAAAQSRYRALVRFLMDRNAEVCLVSFPVTHAYLREVQRIEISAHAQAHSKATAFFSDAAQDMGARYVDARAMISAPNLFRDVDHLNVEGARVFSTRLLRACFDGSGQRSASR
jgi:hypothetical protein